MKKLIGIFLLLLAFIMLFGGLAYGMCIDGYSFGESMKMLAIVCLVVAVFMLFVFCGSSLLDKK